MFKIVDAAEKDAEIIHSLARKIWYPTFKNILSKEQVEYMLDWMYSISSLRKQILELKHKFLLVKEDDKFYGYASYELNSDNLKITKLHKIYLLPETQGRGIGKALLEEVIQRAAASKDKFIQLNVNRNNPAVEFYKKYGFRIIRTEDNPIGEGYFMNDYVMEKELRTVNQRSRQRRDR